MDFYYKGVKHSTSSGGSEIIYNLKWGKVCDLDSRTQALDDDSNKYYDSTGTLKTYVYDMVTALVPYESGYAYQLSGRWIDFPPVAFLDSEKNWIGSAESVTGWASGGRVTHNLVDRLPYVAGVDCDIPSGTAYLCIQSHSTDTFLVQKAPINTEDVDVYTQTHLSSLDGKVIAFFGDSIAHGEGSMFGGTYYGFAEAVNALAPECKCLNYCVGGSYYKAYTTQSSDNRILSQAEQAYADGINPDIIVIEGGYNDGQANACVLSDDWETFDTSTMWGGIEEMINYCQTTWANARMMFATQHYVYAQSLDYMHTYIDGITKLCNKWGIPICDNIFGLGYSTKKLTDVQLHPPYWFYRDFFGPHITAALKQL